MISIVKFHPKHLEVMEIREDELFGVFSLPDIYDRLENLDKSSIQAVTFVLDGRILAVAGFSQPWKGVLEGWIIPSRFVKTHAPVSFPKLIRRYIEAISKTWKCHRFQTTSFDDTFHERWMGWLGFTKEGTLKWYTHKKQNYCIYARYFEWPIQ